MVKAPDARPLIRKNADAEAYLDAHARQMFYLHI